jgi:hypothetical protein
VPYVPDTTEERHLRAAIDRAALDGFERIWWLFAFAGLLLLDGMLIAGGGSWVGIVGSIGGFAVLYWRLRGGHLSRVVEDEDARQLHGVGLRTREQRAFTALMLRQAFTGRNPLRPKPEHDPLANWGARVERAQVSEDAGAE